MISNAFSPRQVACKGTAMREPERIETQKMFHRAFPSTNKVEALSRLNEIALSLVLKVEAGGTVSNCDSRLDEAASFLYEALFDIEGLLQVPPPKLELNPSLVTTSSDVPSAFTERWGKYPSHQQPEYDEGMRYFKSLLSIQAETVDLARNNRQVAATLIYNIGQVRLLQKCHDAAFSCFVDAYIMAECTPGFPNAIVLPTLHNLGYIQYRNGDIASSLQTFTVAYQLCCQQGDNKAHIAATLNCLGVLYFHMPKSDTKRSLECLVQALSIQRILVGKHSQSVATTLNNIGRVHYIDGNFSSALQAYNEALHLRRMLLGDDHLDVAATAFNLGQTHHHKGDLALALQQYGEFLRIALPQLGRCHRDIAFMLKCIAQIHLEQGNDKRALEVYHEALLSCKAALGVHAEVASVLNKLGNLYYKQGDFDVSLNMYQQGLQVERAVFDYCHPNIAVTLSNIAQIHKQRGELSKALSLYKEVYAIQIASVRSRDPAEVATTLSHMAMIYYQSRNYSSALDLYQEALSIRRETFGELNLDVASTLNSIGLVLFKLRNLPMAMDSFSQSLKIRMLLLGDTHREIAVNLYNIATIQTELGNDDEALRYYQETLRVEMRVLGSHHMDVIPTLHYMAHTYQQRGEVHEALHCYLEVLRIQRRNLPDSTDTAIGATLKCIGNLYLLLGDAGGCVEALSEAFRIAKLHDQGAESIAEFELSGFHLYSVAKLHPEAARAA
jgi:tetratricopeptide (TPR) repeat protein